MSIEASQLRISVDEQERWRRVMSVTVPSEVVQAEEQKAAQQLASRARLKGFRKGKVPKKLIESRFSGTLRQEALDKLIGEAYRQALNSQELQPITEGELQDVKYAPSEDLTFEIAFDVQPVFDVARLGGFVVERNVQEVTDEQVDRVLERIQEQNGVWRPEESGQPQDKDLVSVTITRLDGDEEGEPEPRPYEFIIGQGDAIPDIEEAIRGLEPGTDGEFDITFPDDFPDESRRGDKEKIRIQLTGRRVLEVPELDDDLARQVGDFETLDELTAKVREDMQKEADQAGENGLRSRLLDLVLEANPFEVPASMVDRYASAVIGDQGVPEEKLSEIREAVRPEAERAVKRILLVDRIAETQGLVATEDELDERVEEIANANETAVGKVYAELQKSGRLESLERELTENKVFTYLKEQSEIVDAPAA